MISLDMHQDTLQPFFIESWSYSSALSVFELCENLASGLEMNKLTKINHNAVKGELIEIARHQVSYNYDLKTALVDAFLTSLISSELKMNICLPNHPFRWHCQPNGQRKTGTASDCQAKYQTRNCWQPWTIKRNSTSCTSEQLRKQSDFAHLLGGGNLR